MIYATSTRVARIREDAAALAKDAHTLKRARQTMRRVLKASTEAQRLRAMARLIELLCPDAPGP